MDIRLNATIAAALLLGGIAALIGTSGSKRDVPQARLAGAQSTLEQCRENVSIIHDVHWAAACLKNSEAEAARRAACLRDQALGLDSGAGGPCGTALEPPDDSPECTLPDELAQPLNSARSMAENRCTIDTAAPQRVAGIGR